MKIIFTCIVYWALSNSTIKAQQFAAYNTTSVPTLSKTELEAYRKNMWEEPPAAVGWVNDFGGLFNNEEELLLEEQIAHFEKRSGVEIAILSIDSLMIEKDKMEDYAMHILETWGIGKIDKDNGILICICPDYKLVKIVGGSGAKRYIKLQARHDLVKDCMAPYFTKKQYFDGTINAIKTIIINVDKSF
ncbi:MAG: TPM domain-containing protein [Ferruginibacter sp.]